MVNKIFRKIALTLLILLSSFYSFSQNGIPSDDTLRGMFNGEFPKNDGLEDIEIIENEEMIADKLRMKILAAWLLGEGEFILKSIENALEDNSLDYNHFVGMMLLAEPIIEIPEEKANKIRSIKQAISKKYGSNSTIQNYFIRFDVVAAQTYFEPYQIDSFLSTVNPLLISGESKWESNIIRYLFDLNILNYGIKNDSTSIDSFVTALYKIYPNVLEDGYLLHKFNTKNYKIITQRVKHTEEHPFLILQAAISHHKLGQNDSAALFFDKIIDRYNEAENHYKEMGSLPCVFEDETEGSCGFPSTEVEQMLEFYIETSQKEKACTALQFLKATVAQKARHDAEEERNISTQKGPNRLALEEQARIKQQEENDKIAANLKKWAVYCMN